ncbi:hypothetical protein U0035_10935 [Niabella yanshanensis]|uniref:HTH araC/xylS-type domain-containing protein n=1 Tax=Niabella yanshanensis TaxID=577386 RepID=A0ABZ0WD85_9BACT|nr:hypothetical protein [Niabella yanshanensis]WQD40662.1 hypothetical protein U0035_10935 [Niabella yanshanensis]
MHPRSLPIPLYLRPYVKSALWLNRNAGEAFNFHILPRFHPAFIFSTEDTQDVANRYAGNELVFQPCNIYFGGGGVVPSLFTIPVKMDIILVLLHPQGTGAFWQEDAVHFFDRPAKISRDGQQLRILNEMIQEARTIDEKWQHILAFLTKKLLKKLPHNFSYVQRAISLIRQTSGIVSIETLARGSYTSQRNLLDSFRQYVGATPKQLASMARFNSLVKKYIINPDIKALYGKLERHGYHDASHLYKDFSRYVALTPQEFIGQENGINLVV